MLLLVLAGCGSGGQPTATTSCTPATATPAGVATRSPSPAQCAAAASSRVGGTWTGTLQATGTVVYHSAGGTSGPYTGTYAGTLALTEDQGGAITGRARVSPSGCHIGGGKGSTAISFDVTGTSDGRQLRLQLIPSSFHENGVNCGFGLGWTTPPPAESYSSIAAVIPVGPPGTARASWTVDARTGANRWTVRYRVDLTCAGCGGS